MDAKWRGRNGALRTDFGPMLPLVRTLYADGSPAVERQEDGSGFAMYPSGRKAVCIVCRHRSRRVGAILYADREFLAVPGGPRGGFAETDRPSGSRTRHLGAFDDWGIGSVQTVPDPATGACGSYVVSRKSVTVTQADGRSVQAPRGEAVSASNASDLRLRLNPELTVAYDPASGVTLLEFSAGGVQQDFAIGEVWRAGQAASLGKAISPAALFGSISMSSQGSLDAATLALGGSLGALDQTLKIPSGTATLQTLRRQGLCSSSSAPTLGSSQSSAKSLCEGRIKWHFEHALRKTLAADVAPPLERPAIKKDLREGFTYPRPHPGQPQTWPAEGPTPLSLQALSSRQVSEVLMAPESQSLLQVVLVTASWASAPSSSSEHAKKVCEAAHGELHAGGYAERVAFYATEASEAGGIISERRWSNPLVKQYGIKSVPWMLIFKGGTLVMSQNPAPVGKTDGGGLGFSSKLRYAAFGKPRALIIEPVPRDDAFGPSAVGPSSANVFKLQLQTQEALKRCSIAFDLATSLPEARRLVAEAAPPYGLLLASSEIGAAALEEVASRARSRCSKALGFVCHNGQDVGPLDEALSALAARGEIVHGVLRRPLTKSALERALAKYHDAVKVEYPTCGMSKEEVVKLVKTHLDEA